MVELRVHGVQGTTPEALVDAVAAVEVGGDGVGRLVRPADRLCRPAPGPVLQTAGGATPRTVEGYIWGGMTSGGLAKATWALLFPFSLANVAHWMLPPVPPLSRVGRVLGAALRTLLRLAALLLTVLFVTQVAVISLDLVATQCLAPGSGCLADQVPDWTRHLPFARVLVGLLPVALVVLVLHRVSTVDWSVAPSARRATQPVDRRSTMPGAHVVADPDTPTLRALHITAALAGVAMLTLGGPGGPDSAATPARLVWAASVVLIALCAVGVALHDDPPGRAPSRIGRWLRDGYGAVTRAVLLTGGWFTLIATAAARGPMPAVLVGTNAMLQVIGVLLAVLATLVAVLIVPAALLARPAWAGQARELRPWAGGVMAAPMLVVAGLLGGGFGAGVAYTVRPLLGAGELPSGYYYLMLLWGAAAVLAAVAAVAVLASAGGLRWLSSRRRAGGWAPEIGLLHEGRPEDRDRAAAAWWWARWERRHSHHVLLLVAAVLTVGAVVAATLRVNHPHPPEWLRPLYGVGVVAMAALAVILLRLVYLAARRPDAGRRLGILSDLSSFWPREAHPVVPPCYALKVVPEVVARVVEHLADPHTRVVLTGHSQGSLLVAVAAARLAEQLPQADLDRLGLVTAGSQLQWAYPRAFPAVVPHSSLTELAGELKGRWRALCRGTDPLGGAVTTWQRQVHDGRLIGVGYRPDGTEGALAPAERGPTGALVLGGDHWLPDPQRGPFPGRRWRPGVSGHADYTRDPEWDRAVAMAAGLEPLPDAAAPAPAPAAQATGVHDGVTGEDEPPAADGLAPAVPALP